MARRAAVPISTLGRYLRAKSEVPALNLARIARACGVSADFLLWGVPGRTDQPAGSVLNFLPSLEATDLEGFVSIPHLAVRASAGPGLAAATAEVEEPRQIAFRATWLRSLGVAPGNAEFLTAQGDSMYPTIQDGDLMLVDRGYGEVMNGKIYVLVVRDAVVVKRVSLLAAGGLILISDNDRYPSETVPRDEVNSLNFQARVAWYGRAI